jgi:hypothetical protein
MSWRNIQFLLTNFHTLIEKERILTAVIREIDETFAMNAQDHHPEADTASENEVNGDFRTPRRCKGGLTW